ncbi:MAG TPA: OmpA family protein [bacterium]|nr:OmpA family protein [bacterium]
MFLKILKKTVIHLMLAGPLGLLTIPGVLAGEDATFVPVQDEPPAACRDQAPSEDARCARWYYLTEKNRPDAWDHDRPAYSKKQRWYHVGKPVPPPKPRIIVLKGVNFDFDKADIRPDAEPVLRSNLPELQAQNVRVLVVGHTDERGTDEYNQRLSERRAQSVMNWFIQNGIPASRLSAEGRGESEPIAVNEPVDDGGDTPEEDAFADPGRALNRRIELHIQDVVVTNP